MEHRYGKRFPADSKALIFKNGMPVAIGRVRNFGCDGVFIKTEFEGVDINQPLEFEIIAIGNSRSSVYRSSISGTQQRFCRAIVVHRANGGIGLLLREDCEATQANFAAFVAEEMARGQHARETLMKGAVSAPRSAVIL